MKWRPEGWKTPNAYALRDCKPNQCVTSDDVRLIPKKEKEAYEAGADAMLEALRNTGAEAVSLKSGVVTFGQIDIKIEDIDYPSKGTLSFIPDEPDEEKS